MNINLLLRTYFSIFSDERVSPDVESLETFQKNFQDYLSKEGIDLDNVYNANETALFWKTLPDETLLEKDAGDFYSPEDRVTLKVCSNYTGSHKIPLFMIGLYDKPRCFANIKQLPLYYRAQKKCWMDNERFFYWLVAVFLPCIKARNPDPTERYIFFQKTLFFGKMYRKETLLESR